jgi:hypothetical protein
MRADGPELSRDGTLAVFRESQRIQSWWGRDDTGSRGAEGRFSGLELKNNQKD